jgi:glycosyltransferase involved in cell wall biosynthesis
MKIAILGSRGMPARYGGFETLAEEISTRLVKRGHEVTVYCCRPYSETDERMFNGVRRIVLPTIRSKILDKPFYAMLSLLHVVFQKVDVVLMLGLSVSFFCFIPRVFGKRVLINTDGLEWQRKKWGNFISFLLEFEEKMAGVMTDLVVTDSKWVKEYYNRKYGKDSVYITYGADVIDYPPGDVLKKFGLQKEEYILYVSRFEPENNPLLVREAYDEIGKPLMKLVMIGDAPYADNYIRRVKDTKNPNVIFTGCLYGDQYRELLSNAYLYVQATEVGGTHPALLEAMGAGNCVLANDVPEHKEVLQDAGVYYAGREDLKNKMIFLMNNEKIVNEKKVAAVEVIRGEHSWDKVTAAYEQIFLSMSAR